MISVHRSAVAVTLEAEKIHYNFGKGHGLIGYPKYIPHSQVTAPL